MNKWQKRFATKLGMFIWTLLILGVLSLIDTCSSGWISWLEIHWQLEFFQNHQKGHETWIQFKYKWFAYFCYKCGLLDHITGRCSFSNLTIVTFGNRIMQRFMVLGSKLKIAVVYFLLTLWKGLRVMKMTRMLKFILRKLLVRWKLIC